MNGHFPGEDRQVHFAHVDEATLTLGASLEQLTAGMPKLLGSISLVEDRMQQLRAIQAAGKIAEGLIELVQLSDSDLPHNVQQSASHSVRIVHNLPIERHEEGQSPNKLEYLDTSAEIPVQNSTQLTGASKQDSARTDLLEIVEDELSVGGNEQPEGKQAEEAQHDLSSREAILAAECVTSKELMKGIKGGPRIVTEHMLEQKLNTKFRPADLHVLLADRSHTARKGALTGTFRAIRRHPVLGKWLQQTGSRNSLRYWFDSPDENKAPVVSSAEVILPAAIASESQPKPNQRPIPLSKAGLEALGSLASTSVTTDAANKTRLNGGAPTRRPNPALIPPPMQRPTLEQHSEGFNTEQANVIQLTTDGLQFLEHNGVRRLYFKGEHVSMSNTSAVIVGLIAARQEGITFDALREAAKLVTHQSFTTPQLRAHIEAITKYIEKRDIPGWDDSIIDIDGEPYRRLRFSNAAPVSKEDMLGFLAR